MKYLIITIAIVFTLSATTVKAEFTADQAQPVFGVFVPVLDEAISGNDFTADNVQPVFGVFRPVFDASAGGVVAVTPNFGTVIIFEE